MIRVCIHALTVLCKKHVYFLFPTLHYSLSLSVSPPPPFPSPMLATAAVYKYCLKAVFFCVQTLTGGKRHLYLSSGKDLFASRSCLMLPGGKPLL